VTPTYPRHPITLAAQAIAITIWPWPAAARRRPSHKPVIEGAYGLPMGKPLAHLREYVTILRCSCGRGRSTSPATTSRSRRPCRRACRRRRSRPHLGAAPERLSPRGRDRRRGHLLGDAGRLPDADRVARAAGRGGGGGTRAPAPDRARAGQRLDRSGRGAGGVPGAVSDLPKLPFYAAMFAAAGYPVTTEGR
jgi:hypothetical protein